MLEGVHAKLVASFGEREATAGCNSLYEFACRFAGVLADPDLGLLSGCQADADRAVRVWNEMCEAHGWGSQHRARVATALARALGELVPALRYAVNPMLRRPCSAYDIRYQSDRSFQTEFALHDCLPSRVRRLTCSHPEYKLLSTVLDGMATHLRSVSKQNLQAIGTLLDDLIFHDRGDAAPPPLPLDVDEALRALRGVRAREWLARFGRAHHGRAPVSFAHFQRQIKHISVFHHRVLWNGSDQVTAIPVAKATGRIQLCELEYRGSSTDVTSASTSSSATASSSSHNEEYVALRAAITALRHEMCAPVDPLHAVHQVWAFTRQEVLRILDAAVTTEERLIVCLFLTLGLRIGGLSRLQWRQHLSPEALRCPQTVPQEMITVEKNCRLRPVLLATGVRILVARYYREHPQRAVGDNRYLFPSSRPSSRRAHVSTHHIWTRCKAIFARCGLQGSHVHPHTFRHTVIQILFMRGRTFEQIAKWIGHSSPTITSGVYGRLSFNETERIILGDDADAAREREEWHRVYQACKLPTQYRFEEWELAGMMPTTGNNGRASSSKRAALEYRGKPAHHVPNHQQALPAPTSEVLTELQEMRSLLSHFIHKCNKTG